MPHLVCSLGRFLAQPITVVVVVSFWFFFFVDTVELVDNPGFRFFPKYSFHTAVWEDRVGGGGMPHLGLCETRNVDAPRLPSTWSTVEDRTLSWVKARICKTGQVATKANERSIP